MMIHVMTNYDTPIFTLREPERWASRSLAACRGHAASDRPSGQDRAFVALHLTNKPLNPLVFLLINERNHHEIS